MPQVDPAPTTGAMVLCRMHLCSMIWSEPCKLLINLLSSSQLQDLFKAAKVKAKAHHHQLLIWNPSDLLQIDTSYIHDGLDIFLSLSLAPKICDKNHEIL